MTRRYHYAETKAQKQANWLARFTDALLARHPQLAGRVDWDAAKHYCFGGTSVAEAVDQYSLARNLQERKA